VRPAYTVSSHLTLQSGARRPSRIPSRSPCCVRPARVRPGWMIRAGPPTVTGCRPGLGQLVTYVAVCRACALEL